jgi:hypothetical protein
MDFYLEDANDFVPSASGLMNLAQTQPNFQKELSLLIAPGELSGVVPELPSRRWWKMAMRRHM